jgi:hypothetical protein
MFKENIQLAHVSVCWFIELFWCSRWILESKCHLK